MKSLQEKVYDYIKENPNTSYQEIEEALQMKSAARVYVFRLRQRGVLKGDLENGFEIVDEYNPEKEPTMKKDIYLEMIEIYLEDFREADSFNERLKVGKEIRLLLDQIR